MPMLMTSSQIRMDSTAATTLRQLSLTTQTTNRGVISSFVLPTLPIRLAGMSLTAALCRIFSIRSQQLCRLLVLESPLSKAWAFIRVLTFFCVPQVIRTMAPTFEFSQTLRIQLMSTCSASQLLPLAHQPLSLLVLLFIFLLLPLLLLFLLESPTSVTPLWKCSIQI